MKKFSNITGQKVSEKPQAEQKIDERKALKVKMIKLMEQFLSIETHGPIDRYQRFGLIKIKGQEILTEAILSLINNDEIDLKTKLLENLKSDIKDWETIDNKIKELNDHKQDFKINFKINKMLEKYSDDDEILINLISEKINKLDDENKSSYIRSINNSSIKEELKAKINNIFNTKY